MSTSKTKVLQKAFLFLTSERSFQKRWVSLSSIESALRLRYSFGDHYNFDKAMLSKTLGKIDPKIDSLRDPNGHGVYRCKMSGGYFSTIQDPALAPPKMPTTYANNSEWIKLCKIDEKLLARYETKVKSSEHRENTTVCCATRTKLDLPNQRFACSVNTMSHQTIWGIANHACSPEKTVAWATVVRR
jgi:hypothetical protein